MSVSEKLDIRKPEAAQARSNFACAICRKPAWTTCWLQTPICCACWGTWMDSQEAKEIERRDKEAGWVGNWRDKETRERANNAKRVKVEEIQATFGRWLEKAKAS